QRRRDPFQRRRDPFRASGAGCRHAGRRVPAVWYAPSAMKTSLDHLPPRKQRQLAAMVDEICRATEVELKKAYIDARYSTKYAVTEDEIRVMAERVRELRVRVERVCRERIEAAA